MPTILLLGPRCSGKSSVADHLVQSEGFQRVKIASRPTDDSLHFDNAADFLDYATLNWRSRFVCSGVRERKELDAFIKRPWVLVVGCEAGVAWRWQRHNEIARRNDLPEITLEQFVREDDLEMFGEGQTSESASSLRKKTSSVHTLQIPLGHTASQVTLPTIPPPSPEIRPRALFMGERRQHAPLSPLLRMCNLHIQTSSFTTLQDLHAHITELDLTKEDRMRPGWERYFMTLAGLASLRSNCMKRRVGAVLVLNKRVISTGYNGTPRGMRNCNEGGCARCNSTSITAAARNLKLNGPSLSGTATPVKSGVALDECLCLHAEENALLEAGRDRCEGAVIYCNTCPCLRCAVKICQTGCKEVCYSQAYSMDEMSASIFKEAGVVMRQIDLE